MYPESSQFCDEQLDHHKNLMSTGKMRFFMELRDYLEIGAKKAGSLTALGLMFGMSQPSISTVKAHKRALPLDAVIKLADFIDADLKAVIAANELTTEKKEKKRAFWQQLTEHARAASLVFVLATSVNFLLTPYPAEASEHKGLPTIGFVLCKV
jgi:hypothetical protein